MGSVGLEDEIAPDDDPDRETGSLHGLRHSLAAELRAAGYDKEQRKLVLGHDTDEMAEHYAASADLSGELIEIANVLQAGPKRERDLSKPRRRGV